MLIGSRINEEYMDIHIPQEKVNIFLAGIIAKKQQISLADAMQKLKTMDIQALQKQYEPQIRARFSSYIAKEIVAWHNYDEYLERRRKRKNGLQTTLRNKEKKARANKRTLP